MLKLHDLWRFAFSNQTSKTQTLPPNLVLCIPESYIPHIIYLYHDNILGGHQGVDRMYWTIREKFYFPNMLPCIHKYVLCCQTCQSRREKDPITGVHYPRIPVNFRPLSRMSMDVKHMMPSKFGYNHIYFVHVKFQVMWLESQYKTVPASQSLKQYSLKYVVFLGNQKH